uniref:Uncharacterized protein n=1 Tax=Myripristis murdjan TaxID=586833 RepID=A0A667YTV9_9TELE
LCIYKCIFLTFTTTTAAGDVKHQAQLHLPLWLQDEDPCSGPNTLTFVSPGMVLHCVLCLRTIFLLFLLSTHWEGTWHMI